MCTRAVWHFPQASRWEQAQVARCNAWLRIGPYRRIMVLATRFGDGYGWGVVGLWLLLFGGARGTRHLVLGGLAVLGAQVVYNLAKRRLVRRRPCDSFSLPHLPVRMPDAFSFPSGHTTTAFTIALMLGHFSALLWPVALVLAALVGLSRIALGAHFPSDVVAGMLLGCFCASVALLFY
jgi:undecaprenyl-diphosphatase